MTVQALSSLAPALMVAAVDQRLTQEYTKTAQAFQKTQEALENQIRVLVQKNALLKRALMTAQSHNRESNRAYASEKEASQNLVESLATQKIDLILNIYAMKKRIEELNGTVPLLQKRIAYLYCSMSC